ncbi:hypothetical protein NIES25_51640 [Nostoc linckia NIES-25]|nr:hypothetical protein NIES25_05920 [Nostoc linckia NIES-25]BAY78661.1 hypothetical protein NIES25_51370 [Nostoc linckia NIES-25]BAY78688.1 hypothetical protein NIES25_51640 [Nostoc linckia NIES-25]
MLNNPSDSSNGSAVPFDKCTNDEKSLNANGTLLLEANANRSYAIFVNNSNIDITLVLAESANAVNKKGVIIKPRGGSYEINQNNLYTGKISAVAASNCKISFVECSY